MNERLAILNSWIASPDQRNPIESVPMEEALAQSDLVALIARDTPYLIFRTWK